MSEGDAQPDQAGKAEGDAQPDQAGKAEGDAQPGEAVEAEAEDQPQAAAAEGQPDEEELRRRIEEGLRQVRVQDVLLESVVTIINLTARRIAKDDERDLEQARVGIEAVRALTELLEPEPRTQVRNALSELQMLYARHAGGEGATQAPEAGPPAGGAAKEDAGEGPSEPPPAPGGKPPPDLWVPPGSS